MPFFSFALITDCYFKNTLMVGNSISIVNAMAGVIGVFLMYKGCQYLSWKYRSGKTDRL